MDERRYKIAYGDGYGDVEPKKAASVERVTKMDDGEEPSDRETTNTTGGVQNG